MPCHTARGGEVACRGSRQALQDEHRPVGLEMARAGLASERSETAATAGPPSRWNAPPWWPKDAGSRPKPRQSAMWPSSSVTDTDSERAIRWLIALMVLRCDPLAIALTAAASAWSVARS
jgi:hypothetical protein